jgi:hypothetical protein
MHDVRTESCMNTLGLVKAVLESLDGNECVGTP